jgi:hypothetical protein
MAHGAHTERGLGGGRLPTVDDLLGELVDLVLVGLLQVRSGEVEVVEDKIGRRRGWLSESRERSRLPKAFRGG